MRLIFLLRVIRRFACETSAGRKYNVGYYKMIGKIHLLPIYRKNKFFYKFSQVPKLIAFPFQQESLYVSINYIYYIINNILNKI